MKTNFKKGPPIINYNKSEIIIMQFVIQIYDWDIKIRVLTIQEQCLGLFPTPIFKCKLCVTLPYSPCFISCQSRQRGAELLCLLVHNSFPDIFIVPHLITRKILQNEGYSPLFSHTTPTPQKTVYKIMKQQVQSFNTENLLKHKLERLFFYT